MGGGHTWHGGNGWGQILFSLPFEGSHVIQFLKTAIRCRAVKLVNI